MALATKCPHCHTVFRVALDQLKLRGGIVRCGACNEIFDGNAALLEPAAPVAVAPPAVPKLDLELDLDEQAAAETLTHPLGSDPQGRTPDTAAVPQEAGSPLPEPELAPELAPEPAPAPHSTTTHRREPAFDMPSEHIVAVALDDLHHFDDEPEPIVPAPAPAPRDDDSHSASRLDNEAAERAADDASAADLLTGAPEGALLAAGTGTAAAAPDEHGARDDEPDNAPEFVRQAERRERTRSITRLAMIAGIPLLAFMLLGQTVFTLRNGLAADYPAMKPALQALCAPLGCTVELPRRIDALAIEEGELQTLAPDTYSFVTVLRNQSRSVQAWPHIELVLNDGADKPVLRRVFAPRDYLGKGALAQGFRPRSEQAVKLYFKLDGLRASGYRIAIFHP